MAIRNATTALSININSEGCWFQGRRMNFENFPNWRVKTIFKQKKSKNRNEKVNMFLYSRFGNLKIERPHFRKSILYSVNSGFARICRGDTFGFEFSGGKIPLRYPAFTSLYKNHTQVTFPFGSFHCYSSLGIFVKYNG